MLLCKLKVKKKVYEVECKLNECHVLGRIAMTAATKALKNKQRRKLCSQNMALMGDPRNPKLHSKAQSRGEGGKRTWIERDDLSMPDSCLGGVLPWLLTSYLLSWYIGTMAQEEAHGVVFFL